MSVDLCSCCAPEYGHGETCPVTLLARIEELEEAGTIAKRLLIQGHYAESLEHLIQNFKP